MATILAIETSCDETAVAIVKNREVYSSLVASQIDLHQSFGGVVPEVACREHLRSLNPCVEQALAQAGIGWSEIDAVAATVAPGLVGALMMGMSAGKTLAILKTKPFLGIHHLEGHIYAAYLSQPNLEPPFLCLLVSGGHTSLILVEDCGKYQQLGSTRDDAAGEAFDKVARLLGLGYPGGPIIDKVAQQGNPQAFSLPEGKVAAHPYDFSFSGLKTAVLRLVQQIEKSSQLLPVADIAASFQATVARSLTKKTLACAQNYGLKTIVVGGGVAANSALREYLQKEAQDLQIYFPPLRWCTDNAAMIACAAAEHFDRGDRSSLTLGVRSRLNITEVPSLYTNCPETLRKT
jgi:N6-L-threonylcarbamoyladenine synthase